MLASGEFFLQTFLIIYSLNTLLCLCWLIEKWTFPYTCYWETFKNFLAIIIYIFELILHCHVLEINNFFNQCFSRCKIVFSQKNGLNEMFLKKFYQIILRGSSSLFILLKFHQFFDLKKENFGQKLKIFWNWLNCSKLTHLIWNGFMWRKS